MHLDLGLHLTTEFQWYEMAYISVQKIASFSTSVLELL
jgi:hypothetical protein